MSKPRVAFLGTGIMGLPMASNMLVAGYPLAVWNRSKEKAKPLVEAGAETADCPAAAVAGAEFVIVMVSDGAAADEVLFGKNGAMGSLDSVGVRACVIVCSTLSPQTAREQAKKCAALNVDYLDAPVSGGENGAQQGTLAIMVGGDAEVFDRAKPLLQAAGNPKHIGELGCGQLAKLANQAIVGTTIAAITEALILAEAGGASAATVRDALFGGFADSAILRQHGQRMIDGDFAPGGPAKYQLRDLQNAAREAADSGIVTPVTTAAAEMFGRMVAAGFGEDDHSALYRFWQQRITP